MANIGSFGAERDAARSSDPDTFTYLGVEIRVADRVGSAPLFDYAEAAASGVDASDPRGMAAMKAMIKDCVDKDDWALFWGTFTDQKGTPDELAEICAALYQHISARPTDRPAGLSVGPLNIGSGSNGPALADRGFSSLSDQEQTAGGSTISQPLQPVP